MFRTAGFNAEIVACAIDKPVAPALSNSAFNHAVLGLAAFSLSARSVLALRG